MSLDQAGKYDELTLMDQLFLSMANKDPILSKYAEPRIQFPPTYRRGDTSATCLPSYASRVLYTPSAEVRCAKYDSISFVFSEHDALLSQYSVNVREPLEHP
jgi:hypothetical protein